MTPRISEHIEIRPARIEDAPVLSALLEDVGWFSALRALSTDERAASVHRALKSMIENNDCTVLVAVDSTDRPLGYVSVHWLDALFMPGPEGYLSELFLFTSARGQGVGTALLERVTAAARDRGVHRLMLLNGTHRESYEREFYQKNGWDERPTMANFVLEVTRTEQP